MELMILGPLSQFQAPLGLVLCSFLSGAAMRQCGQGADQGELEGGSAADHVWARGGAC